MKVTLLRASNPFKDPEIFTQIYSVDSPEIWKDLLSLMAEFHSDCKNDFGSFFEPLYQEFVKNPTIENLNLILYGKDDKNDDQWFDITNIEIRIEDFEVVE